MLAGQLPQAHSPRANLPHRIKRWLKRAGAKTFEVLLAGANSSTSPMSVNISTSLQPSYYSTHGSM